MGKPVRQVRSGRLSISLWKRTVEKDGEKVEVERACVQHSVKNRETEQWNNQQIWMNADELRDLANALEDFSSKAEETVTEEGEKSPSSSSMRAHVIVEYIKANELDSGLDVFDLDEMDASEVLACYGIYAQLKPFEQQLVLCDLRRIIEQQEFAEMARCAVT